jgi:hypothetical protein
MEIKNLEQMCIEDRYSRSNIRARVLLDIMDSVETDLAIAFDKAAQAIHNYAYGKVSQTYWSSKLVRVQHLRNLLDKKMTINDLVLEILIIVMPMKTAQPIQGPCGRLGGMLGYGDIFDGVKTAAELLAVVCFSDLYDIIPARESEGDSMSIMPRYSLENETNQFISDTKYLPPMICKPEVLTRNFQSGYLTIEDSVILKGVNHHEEYVSLDVLNMANGTALALDTNILRMKEKPNKPFDSLHKDGSVPTVKVILEREKNFLELKAASKIVYKELLDNGNEFFNCHKFDSRSRKYSQGYHVHIQGSEYKKAIINLATEEVITDGIIL